MLVKSSNTLLAASLQQQAVNQPIISFTAETDVADAMWRYVLVYATGSVVQDGTAMNDVSAVRVWYDADNNSFLGAGDVMIGSGTFGNTIFGPLVSRVNLTRAAHHHPRGGDDKYPSVSSSPTISGLRPCPTTSWATRAILAPI